MRQSVTPNYANAIPQELQGTFANGTSHGTCDLDPQPLLDPGETTPRNKQVAWNDCCSRIGAVVYVDPVHSGTSQPPPYSVGYVIPAPEEMEILRLFRFGIKGQIHDPRQGRQFWQLFRLASSQC